MREFFNNLLDMNERLGNLPANELHHESISPHSSALRSGHRHFQRPSPEKQLLSSNTPTRHLGKELQYESFSHTLVQNDGLTGSWQRPVLAESDPFSFIHVGTDQLNLYAGNDANYSIGLKANGVDVYGIGGIAVTGDIFSHPGSYTDPNAYFTGLTGTYILDGGGINFQTAGGTIGFSPNSLTIGTIPEPSSALLTGLGLADLVFRRRRHAR